MTITKQAQWGPELLQIEGEVIRPLTLDLNALANLPSEYQMCDVGALSTGMRGTGIRVDGLLRLATVCANATHAIFHSGDGKYSACLTLDQARVYGILMYEFDGEPLPKEKGGPFRLITPGLGDLCANVKQVGKIEITSGAGKDTRPLQVCS